MSGRVFYRAWIVELDSESCWQVWAYASSSIFGWGAVRIVDGCED